MDKEYIERKIKNCQGLVDTALSEEQKEVYQGYLDFWQEKLEKPKPSKEVIIEPEPEEPIPEPILEEPILEPEEEEENGDPERPESYYVEQFKAQFPNKLPYRTANGEQVLTNAFKEFLKNNK